MDQQEVSVDRNITKSTKANFFLVLGTIRLVSDAIFIVGSIFAPVVIAVPTLLSLFYLLRYDSWCKTHQCLRNKTGTSFLLISSVISFVACLSSIVIYFSNENSTGWKIFLCVCWFFIVIGDLSFFSLYLLHRYDLALLTHVFAESEEAPILVHVEDNSPRQDPKAKTLSKSDHSPAERAQMYL
eukprot:TRINITY_DN482_c2_g1_i1.p1 TRINITY_DN482_c2_g1~~TRINITY_DN482_c2_g1_i1.p1  ORF type:complete len:184 (+),score=49.82 TRINITY_DN482_c2_g1_i1:163-714(+)